ncbi:pleckstrin homology domain-containing family J member 1-like [Hetaerina americana]|uniref:pleckstrin homology domain-containing family J member 1-like n=1 Tax=Hetaerina americana TaxID=62018 RepID=UPI003A7F45CC
MRFSGRELAQAWEKTPTLEGRLNYRPPGGNFGQSGYKERWFRLRCNLLFYFRISETGKVESEPSGLFVLENSSIQLEQSSSIPFVFSIIFKDEPNKKHLFSGRSDSNIQGWVDALKQCSYEYLRSQMKVLRKKVTVKTGKDPLLMYPHNEGVTRDIDLLPLEKAEGSPRPARAAPPLSTPHLPSKGPQGISFQSHLAPVPPPRSSSPKSAPRAAPVIPSQPIEPVKASVQSAPIRSAPKEPVNMLKPVLAPVIQPVKLPPPMKSTPKAPSRPAPHVPSSEMNLIDL